MARSLAAGPCPGSRQSARPGRLQVGRAGRAQMSVAVARAGAEQEEPERYQNSLDSLSSSPTLSSSSSSSSYASPASGRRQLLAGALATAASVSAPGAPARAAIGSESQWPLWLALPVAPFSKKKTVRAEAGPGVWTFDQCLGIYYVTVNLRMTVIALQGGGLFVYAPVAPTEECLALLQPLIDEHGPVRFIVLPSVAVEHKVNAGPFARKFPAAEFYACDRQYSFPVPLPSLFLGLPRWTKPLPESSEDAEGLWGGELQHLVLTVKPGPGSEYQDAAFFHAPSKTLLVCDAISAVTDDPPPILTSDPEYTRALLFHARDSKDEVVEDSPEARRKGWRRIVILSNFFLPGCADTNLGPGPILEALKTPGYPLGWGGWAPFTWREEAVKASFEAYSANGKPTIFTILQIILSRGGDGGATLRWVDKVKQWDFERVVPAHFNAPLNIGPAEFSETYDFIRRGANEVRFCDEDVRFLRGAEEGFLNFSVYKTKLGTLRGRPCGPL
eukprot:jgi/Tetstr1/466118/TSEL_010681.t1